MFDPNFMTRVFRPKFYDPDFRAQFFAMPGFCCPDFFSCGSDGYPEMHPEMSPEMLLEITQIFKGNYKKICHIVGFIIFGRIFW